MIKHTVLTAPKNNTLTLKPELVSDAQKQKLM